MRLDKYLKVTRLIKRRTVAKELLDRDIFTINNKIAKPSSTVNVGDIVVILLGRHKITFKVKDVKEKSKNLDPTSLYEILEEETIDND